MSALVNLFYIYDPWLFHFFRMSLFIGLLCSIFFLYKCYKKEDKLIVSIDSIAIVIGLILLSTIPLLVNQTTEIGVIAMYVKSLLLFLFGIMIYNLYYRHNQGKQQLIRDLKWGIILQAVIGLLALLNFPLAIDIALGTNVNSFLPQFQGSEQEYRLYNFTSSAFFQLSAFYLILLHFLLAYAEKYHQINGVYILLILFIGLISGRTFFMFSVLSLLVYFKLRYIPVLLLFIIGVLFFAIFYSDHPYVEHALEPVINLIKGVDRLSSSTDTLMQKHLFMPEMKQLMIGDGLYYMPDKTYYGGSDSGFIRQVLYGGIGYMLICLVFTAYFIKRIADNWFDGSWKFMLSTLILLSILNIKADTYAFPGIMFVLIMFLSLFGHKGKQVVLFEKKE
ncbi:MAG: hypothetical protein Q4B95_00840 [Lonepinella koalarum]|nr:hypothetical protein [Lonepinella koalarum]